MDASEFVFPEPWRDLRGHAEEDARERTRLETELVREVAEGHALAGRSWQAVAACGACDDVLFAGDGGRFATVHLSFTNQAPDNPPWPATDLHDSWDDAAAHVLAHEPGWDD